MLADGQVDVLCPVVRDDFGVAETINEIFWAKVVRVEESAPMACNVDKKAFWVLVFSFLRCHEFMANRAFRLGTG